MSQLLIILTKKSIRINSEIFFLNLFLLSFSLNSFSSASSIINLGANQRLRKQTNTDLLKQSRDNVETSKRSLETTDLRFLKGTGKGKKKYHLSGDRKNKISTINIPSYYGKTTVLFEEWC